MEISTGKSHKEQSTVDELQLAHITIPKKNYIIVLGRATYLIQQYIKAAKYIIASII